MIRQIPMQLKFMRFNRVLFKEKKAFEKNWQNNPYSYEQITAYFPKENYGVLCGKELRVLDDDSPDEKLLKLFLEKFGETFRVRNHLYFKFDNGQKNKIIFFDGKIHLGELQGEGTYVVGAGSTHPSGEIYEIKNDLQIKIISYDKFMEVFGKYVKSQEGDRNIEPIELTKEDNEILKDIKRKWKKGDRQNLTLSLAGYFRKEKGFGFERTSNIVKKICEVMKDEDVKERLEAVKQTFFKDENQIKGIAGLIERKIRVGKNSEDKDFYYIEPKINKDGKIIKIKKVSIPKVTDYILKNYNFNFKTLYGMKGEIVWAWEDGCYSPNGREIIKTLIENLLKGKSTNHYVNEIFEKIKRKTNLSQKEFENIPLKYINLKNGVYNIETKKLNSHNPNLYFKTKIPVIYNPKTKCPKFQKFLDQTLYKDDIKVLQEWFGFCLYRNYFIKKGLIGVGETDTAKTLLLNVLIRFIGEENKCGLSLQKISSNDKFSKMALKDKLLNCYDDLSSQDLADGGGFKIATGGGFITAEQKFGDTYEFKSFAKQMYECNKVPPIKDNDDPAYFSRWMYLKHDNQIPKNKQDNFLYNKLTTETELSGILSWALGGLHRLLKIGKFSYNKSKEQIKLLMERSGNPLASFVQDILIKNPDAKITKEQMFEVYSIYVDEEKLPRLSKEQLGRRLGSVATFLLAKAGKKKRYWRGAEINAEFVKKHDLHMDLDTLDTSINITSKESKSSKNKELVFCNISSKKASKVSNKKDDSEVDFSKLNLKDLDE